MPDRAVRDELWAKLNALGTSKNLISGYKDPFGYEDMKGNLDDIFGEYETKLNRDVAEGIATEQGGTAARMASRGITGGSVVDDTLSGVATKINTKKYNALSNLGIGKAGQTMDLQKLFDDMGFRQLLANQGQENTITGEKYNKAGMLANYLSDWEAADLAKENSPGFLEDLFSGIGDISSLIPGIGQFISMGSKAAGGAARAIR
jgi:hypothetical protein